MKDLNISKELIKSVLAEETENLSEDFSFDIDEDYIVFRDEGETLFDYNIYKFAFKCKEWAFKKNYTIVDGIDGIGEDICYIKKLSEYSLESYYEQGKNYHNVFKACEWILEDLKEKI